MPSKTNQPLDVHAFNALVQRFHSESDRAAAVLAGGYLDETLRQILRDILVPGARTNDLFDGNGALRSFGSKISMIYAMGVANEQLCRDMDLVRKIRNHFAHHIWDASFHDSPVSQWVSEMTTLDQAMNHPTGERVEIDASPRERYLITIGISIIKMGLSPKLSRQMQRSLTGV